MWTVEKDMGRFYYAYDGVRKTFTKDLDWSALETLEDNIEWAVAIPSEIYEYEYKDGKFIEYLSL